MPHNTTERKICFFYWFFSLYCSDNHIINQVVRFSYITLNIWIHIEFWMNINPCGVFFCFEDVINLFPPYGSFKWLLILPILPLSPSFPAPPFCFHLYLLFFLFLSMLCNIWLYSWHHVINDSIVESVDYVIFLWRALDFFLSNRLQTDAELWALLVRGHSPQFGDMVFTPASGPLQFSLEAPGAHEVPLTWWNPIPSLRLPRPRQQLGSLLNSSASQQLLSARFLRPSLWMCVVLEAASDWTDTVVQTQHSLLCESLLSASGDGSLTFLRPVGLTPCLNCVPSGPQWLGGAPRGKCQFSVEVTSFASFPSGIVPWSILLWVALQCIQTVFVFYILSSIYNCYQQEG